VANFSVTENALCQQARNFTLPVQYSFTMDNTTNNPFQLDTAAKKVFAKPTAQS
jgi:hypothetical protein